MVDVEKQHEHTRAWILGCLPRLRHGVWLTASVLRAGAPNNDLLELIDGLGDPVLEDLEVFLAEIGDRLAIARGVDVDTHVAGVGAESRLGCGLFLRSS